ncbi:hypothetical protein ACLB2K_002348 [Fragaria x ananassa]
MTIRVRRHVARVKRTSYVEVLVSRISEFPSRPDPDPVDPTQIFWPSPVDPDDGTGRKLFLSSACSSLCRWVKTTQAGLRESNAAVEGGGPDFDPRAFRLCTAATGEDLDGQAEVKRAGRTSFVMGYGGRNLYHAYA